VRPGPAPGELIVRDGDRVERLYAIAAGDTTWVFHDGITYEVVEQQSARGRSSAPAGSLTAPMPATVVHVNVAAGDAVKRGDVLIVLEAMKMELPVRAPADGRVTAVHCEAGQLVQPDTSLIELGPREPRADAEPGRGIA
jgi:acetyl/propionyl-CoA carboxylase alpha subunit